MTTENTTTTENPTTDTTAAPEVESNPDAYTPTPEDMTNLIAYAMHICDCDPIAALSIASGAFMVLARASKQSTADVVKIVIKGYQNLDDAMADEAMNQAARFHGEMIAASRDPK